MDRRGSGASDAVPLKAIPTWEELAEDIIGVLDAAESELTDLVGVNEVGPIAVLFAAMHPERVGSLILINTAARYMEAPDYPIGVAPAALDTIFDMLAATWGSDEFAAATNPTRVDDREFIKAAARMNRASATPSTAAAQMKYFLGSMDVRPFLPLLLEMATRELHGEPGHQGLTNEVVVAVGERAALHLRSPAEASIFDLLKRTLGLGH